jgi:hypothetical protein
LDANNIDGDDTAPTPLPNGTAIIQWIDQSGNNNHAGQATEGNRPTYGAAGPQRQGSDQLHRLLRALISPGSNIRVIAAVIKQASTQSAVTKPFGGNQNLTTSAKSLLWERLTQALHPPAIMWWSGRWHRCLLHLCGWRNQGIKHQFAQSRCF